jgi:hypothetical protein
VAKDYSDFGGGAFVADLELTGGELVFAVLVFRRDNTATHGAMQMFAALSRVTAGFGMTAGAHQRYSDRGERIAQRRALARAKHDPNLRERDSQSAHQLDKLAVAHRE